MFDLCVYLLEYLHGAEDAGVDDAGDGEGSAHDGADGGQKVVERRPLLVVPHGDRVQVKPKKFRLRLDFPTIALVSTSSHRMVPNRDRVQVKPNFLFIIYNYTLKTIKYSLQIYRKSKM